MPAGPGPRPTPKSQAARLAKEVLERLLDLGESDPVGVYRDLAQAIVEYRATFTHDGRPDWSGRSGEYRDAIERLYRQAELPPDSESAAQSKIRYHVGNVVREVAPAEDLEALGLRPKGPAARSSENRRTARAAKVPSSVKRAAKVTNPVLVAQLGLDALRLVNHSVIDDEDLPALHIIMRGVVDEALAFIAATPTPDETAQA